MSGKREVELRRNSEEKKGLGKIDETANKRGRPSRVETLGKKLEKGTQNVGSMLREAKHRTETGKLGLEEGKESAKPEEGHSETSGRYEEEKNNEGNLMGELVKAVKDLIEENKIMRKEIQELKQELNERYREELLELKEDIRRKEEKRRREQEEWRRELESLKEHYNNKVGEECRRALEDEGIKGTKRQARGEETKDKDMRYLKEYIQRQEKMEKKNNIVVRGLNIKRQNVKSEIGEFIKEKLGVEAEILWARKIENRGNCLVVVKLVSWEDKQNIMRNKKKLGGENIYIEQDLTFKEREIQRSIAVEVRKLRAEGKNVKVGFQKNFLEGKWIPWENWREQDKEDF